MIAFAKTFFVSLVVLGALDFIWLGFVVKKFNDEQLSAIGRMSGGEITPLKTPTILAYLVMALALTLFAAPKTVDGVEASFAWGLLLGFSLYAIYDLTNLAILKDYPTRFALVDMAWGTFLLGAANVVLYFLRNYLG